MTQTRRKLLENFDDEVREKLRIRANDSPTARSFKPVCCCKGGDEMPGCLQIFRRSK
jgi:hypothetical protein